MMDDFFNKTKTQFEAFETDEDPSYNYYHPAQEAFQDDEERKFKRKLGLERYINKKMSKINNEKLMRKS